MKSFGTRPCSQKPQEKAARLFFSKTSSREVETPPFFAPIPSIALPKLKAKSEEGDLKEQEEPLQTKRIEGVTASDPVQRQPEIEEESKPLQAKGAANIVKETPKKKAVSTSNKIKYTAEGDPFCCDEGKKIAENLPNDRRFNPAKSRELFKEKHEKQTIDNNFSVEGQEIMMVDSMGPKNFVKGRLSPLVRDSLEMLLKAASMEGKKVFCDDTKPSDIPKTYRDLEGQWQAWHHWGHPPNFGPAAKPGNSPHGTGRAIDFDLGTDMEWLLKNAGDYGWVNYAGEDWHYDKSFTVAGVEKHIATLKNAKFRHHKGKKEKREGVPITKEERTVIGENYYAALVSLALPVAIPWNTEQNYPKETWLKVQECLGMAVGDRTGAVDKKTIKALIRFQMDKNLKPDGKVETMTLKVLGVLPGWSGTFPPPAEEKIALTVATLGQSVNPPLIVSAMQAGVDALLGKNVSLVSSNDKKDKPKSSAGADYAVTVPKSASFTPDALAAAAKAGLDTQLGPGVATVCLCQEEDKDKPSINVGATFQGKIERIPMEGLSSVRATVPEDPQLVEKKEFTQGRALVLVPDNVNGAVAEVEVLLHLHGHTKGYKTATQKDIDDAKAIANSKAAKQTAIAKTEAEKLKKTFDEKKTFKYYYNYYYQLKFRSSFLPT